MKWKLFSRCRRSFVALGFVALFCASRAPADAQRISLESLRHDGYGAVSLERPRPNSLTVVVTINGRRHRLLVDTGWLGDGIGLVYGEAIPRTSIVTGSQIPIVTGGATVTLGNVQLTHVPVAQAKMPNLGTDLWRLTIGVDGAIGVGFLRTCSAFIDLENLRLYLRPPGEGRRVRAGQALTRFGLAAIPFQRASNGACIVPAEVNGFAGQMLIDTSAYLSIIDKALSATIHARPITTTLTRVHPRPRTQDEFAVVTRIDKISEEAYNLIGSTGMTPLHSFRLGGVPVRAPDIRVGALNLGLGMPRGIIGKLGVDILGSNGAIVDFAENELLIRPK